MEVLELKNQGLKKDLEFASLAKKLNDCEETKNGLYQSIENLKLELQERDRAVDAQHRELSSAKKILTELLSTQEEEFVHKSRLEET